MRARPMPSLATCLATCLVAGLVLAGCESMPTPGDTVHAEVTAVPRSRGELGGGFTSLHAALHAGVARREAEQGRLLRAQCVDDDPAAPGGLRPRSATLLLPEGRTVAVGQVVEIDTLTAAHAADRRRHGRLVSVPPALAPDDPAWRVSFGTPRPLCRPPGLAEGRWRVQLAGPVAAWEIDFALAEKARHESIDDTELAAGRIVQVSCQLKVIDGADWTRVNWLARLPAGLEARPGQVMRLRTGAEEGGRHSGPLAAVLGPAPERAAPGGTAVVRCR